MKSIKILGLITLIITSSFSATLDCKLKKSDINKNLADKIICKYTLENTNILNKKRSFKIDWINPNGKIERSRIIKIKPKTKSFYDYRFAAGRTKGMWTVTVEEIKKDK